MDAVYLKTCDNCYDYDRDKKLCLIRYVHSTGETRRPKKRKPSDKGCEVFMLRP